MSKNVNLELLKDLGTFWYNDTSVPQLFERTVLDNYIQSIQDKLPDSKELKGISEEVENIFRALKTVKKESETCSKIVEPLLGVLGYIEKKGNSRSLLFDEQRVIVEDDSRLIPDYTLFSSLESQENANELAEELYFEKVDLILEAKRIGKDLLSKTDANKSLDDRAVDSVSSLSPLSQIRKYVRAANSEYGIVTNGNDWILIAKTSRNYLSTYHIRLTELLQLAQAIEDYRLLLYWWLPFSKFFLLDNEGVGAKKVREETAHFTTSLELDLKQRLTPVVIDLLNEVARYSQDSKYVVAHKEELILDVVRFIYQVLYIGCLEDRNLLPVNNPTYRHQFSLKELFGQLTGASVVRANFNNGFLIHGYLSKLMSLISSGCRGVGGKKSIAEFSVDQAQFTLSPLMKLPDNILKEILLRILRFGDSLTQQVSLRALDTIQFGNIYEHILRLEISYSDKTKKFKIDSKDDAKFERSTAVYTPHHIVEQMIADIVEEYSFSSWQDVERLRIVDPCFVLSGLVRHRWRDNLSQKSVRILS